jgi:hypothetical protein
MSIEILPDLLDKSVDDLKSGPPEELRGKTPDELQQYVEVLDAHLRSIHQDEDTGELRDKTAPEQKAFDYGLKLRDAAIRRSRSTAPCRRCSAPAPACGRGGDAERRPGQGRRVRRCAPDARRGGP